MLDVDDAVQLILSKAAPLEPQLVDIADAVGRALSVDVYAVRTLPPWDNSAMDGYAVRAKDVADGPTRLRVIETIHAGQTPRHRLPPLGAARVMTGAPLPQGADAVVMQERTHADGDHVEVDEPVAPGTFVRPRGEDAREGALLLEAGTALGVPEAALLYAQGLSKVNVPARPKVALLSTGDELCAVGDEPSGRIVDTNAPSLALCVARAGGEPAMLGIARDDRDEVTALFESARGYDVVISSAGVSVGEKDFVKEALERLGVATHLWRVAIKPGKPLVFGTLGRTLFFGLPGNPASSLVTFELFVRPVLRRLMGHLQVLPTRLPGRVELRQTKQAGLTHYVRVTVEYREGALWATPLVTQRSGALRSAAQASHLMVFPKEATLLQAGDPVELIPVSWMG